MLQRVQTLFLMSVILCMVLSLFFPIWQKADLDQDTLFKVYALYGKEVKPDGTEAVLEYFPYLLVGIFAIASAGVALVEIFQYNNRLTQIKMGALNSLLMSSVLGISLYLTFQVEKIIAPETRGDYGIGLFMTCFGLILNVLANRFIRRDEKLLRSVDRLR